MELKKKWIALLLSVAIVTQSLAMPVLAEGSTSTTGQKASRAYVVSMFVQSVGRNNLKKAPADLKVYSDGNTIEAAYQSDVALALGNGLLQGDNQGLLRPNDPITRIEALVLLDRSLPDQTGKAGTPLVFTDVPTWAKAEIDRLSAEGLVKGYGNGKLGANDLMTKEQVQILTDRVDAQMNSTRPQDDFDRYVNGKTYRNEQIPQGYGAWRVIYDLDDKVSTQICSIVDTAIANCEQNEMGSDAQRIADFYLSAVDMEQRNADGIKQLKPYLDRIENAKTVDELMSAMAYINKSGFYNLLVFNIDSDMKDSQHYVVYITGADTGLSRELFLSEDNPEILKAYHAYLETLFRLSGEPEAKTSATEVYEFQKKLAIASMPTEDQNNVEKVYHPYTKAELVRLFPTCDFEAYLKEAHMDQATKFILMDENLIKTVSQSLTKENLPLLKKYMKAILFNDFAKVLTEKHRQAARDYEAVTSGIIGTKTDQQEAIQLVQYHLGWQIGQLYVQQYFSEESKRDVEQMVKNLIGVYEKRIDQLDWMSDQTKKAAKKKLETMTMKIGYPDHYPTLPKSVSILSPEKGGSLVGNILCLGKANQQSKLKKIGQKVDRTEWEMTPQTVNAYYDPMTNEIVFPAAILQAPFYNKEASAAVNLGGIGTVIGHEMSHAFDIAGAQYDENGNAVNWWTDEDYKKFQALVKRVEDYYSSYEILPGVRVDGTLTVGENIADLGGVAAALDLVGTKQVDREEFFQSYAAHWAIIATDSYVKTAIKTDVHAPDRARINAVLSTVDAFYETYDVKPGDGMYVAPENRVGIW